MDERYSRQIMFDRIGEKGQEMISDSSICIVGCGALGSNNAEIMARSGVKRIILIDDDNIELSNLQRQTLYAENDIGKPKAETLKKRLIEINSKLKVEAYDERLTEKNLKLLKSDIILDGTDNFETRFLINRYAVENDIPYVFGSAVKSEGMIYSVVKGKPCLNCLFNGKKGFETSDTSGIIAPAIRMAAAIQCTEAIKIITEQHPTEELIKFNIWDNDFQKIKVKKNPRCSVC